MHRRIQEERLNEWLSRHRGLLIKVARSFTKSLHDQDDLLQEIAFQLWKSAPRYKPEVAETTWLYRVALYTAINWSRREKVREQRVREFSSQQTLKLKKQDSDNQRVEWLYDRIAELDPVDRSLALLVLEGFSYREMSETLGISESNVGSRINRIKKRLSQQFEQEKQDEL